MYLLPDALEKEEHTKVGSAGEGPERSKLAYGEVGVWQRPVAEPLWLLKAAVGSSDEVDCGRADDGEVHDGREELHKQRHCRALADVTRVACRRGHACVEVLAATVLAVRSLLCVAPEPAVDTDERGEPCDALYTLVVGERAPAEDVVDVEACEVNHAVVVVVVAGESRRWSWRSLCQSRLASRFSPWPPSVASWGA